MSDEPSREPEDAPADAVPDPRDRRRGERRGGRERRNRSGQAPRERREEPSDRRSSDDRRRPIEVPEEYRASGRNINEYPLAEEELEFINAINAYKQRYDKPFPTWSEVLHVVRALGYRKPEPPSVPPAREG